jgi:hypothetical protein
MDTEYCAKTDGAFKKGCENRTWKKGIGINDGEYLK